MVQLTVYDAVQSAVPAPGTAGRIQATREHLALWRGVAGTLWEDCVLPAVVPFPAQSAHHKNLFHQTLLTPLTWVDPQTPQPLSTAYPKGSVR